MVQHPSAGGRRYFSVARRELVQRGNAACLASSSFPTRGETRSFSSTDAGQTSSSGKDLQKKKGKSPKLLSPEGLAKLGKRLRVRVLEAAVRFCKKVKSLTWAFIRDPHIVKEWYEDIRDAVVHFCRWVATGFRLFGADVRASFYLLKRVVKGYPLTLRQRNLLVRTTSDCLKLIPFSFFIIVPFAEVLLPFFLRIFPGMLPSTFFERKYDNVTMARKLKAKEEMAKFWQQVVLERTKDIAEDSDSKFANKAVELQKFQEKLVEGKEYPRLREILRFSKLFEEELSLKNFSEKHLRVMSKMLGLPQANSWWPRHLEVQLRHHITNLRSEDREYHWEGIDSLSRRELIEACRKRGIRFHEVEESEMRQELNRWLDISANHRNIPTILLLWIQSFYLQAPEPGIEIPAERVEINVKPREEEHDAKEAFHDMAERQKASFLATQQKLEVLRKEVDEVIERMDEAEEGKEEQGTVPAPESSVGKEDTLHVERPPARESRLGKEDTLHAEK